MIRHALGHGSVDVPAKEDSRPFMRTSDEPHGADD
jgi:hypothetical protein